MISVEQTSWQTIYECLSRAGVTQPLEQTEVWAAYQNEIDGRTSWEPLVVKRDGEDIATVFFVEYHTHGYRYVRSSHGPVWICEPDEQLEEEVVRALQDYVHKRDHKQVFLRMAIAHELSCTSPVLSTVPYDTTVVLDLTGGEEDILSRMKPRGRRDVRKSVREAPVTCADETEQALASFSEYYEVMCETAGRDGFAPAPQSDYELMLRVLGAEHVRVYAARLEDGSVCSWSICTLQGKRATRYYAASLTSTMRMHVSDRLCFFECCELGKRGFTEYDLMGIGSDFAPSLKGLNEFKTKFSKEVTPVAPDRDVPVRKTTYALLHKVKDVRTRK